MWLLVSLAAHATPLEQVPNPRDRGAWISDVAEVIAPEVEARLNARLSALHDATDAEVAVVTVQDVPDEARAFATALFQRWGVGDAAADNGLVVLMVVGKRRLSMVTGYGLEPIIPDGWLGELQTRAMVPRFKAGDYGGGLEAGITDIDVRLREHAAAVREGARGQPKLRREGGGASSAGTVIGWAVAGMGGAGFTGLLVALALRRRRCPDCRTQMYKLSEAKEDAHLDAGQQREEEVGAIEHSVWICPSCHRTDVLSRKKLLTGFETCPKCAYRTAKETRTTVRSPSTSSTGLDKITTACVHCHYKVSRNITTAKVVESSGYDSSSSSFSGGGSSFDSSSFGGGSTGGGGADSSW